MLRRSLHLIIFLFITVQFTSAQGQNQRKITINDLPQNVSIHQLDNGLQVLLIENPALPMVGVNMVIKIGSAYETFATSGMSHMLEHLLFNGTDTRTQKELYDQVDQIGGYNNANTGEYFTNFMMVTPAEYIKQGMDLQADMLFNSTLPEEKFEKEKGIVLEEIAKSLAEPDEQYDRNIESILYIGHALSMSTLGTYSTIEHMSRDEVYGFYKKNYVPNNMVMSVIGSFDQEKILNNIRAIYGQASPGQISKDPYQKLATGFEPVPASDKVLPEILYRTYGGENKHLQLFYKLPTSAQIQFYELLDMTFENQISELEKSIKERFPEMIKAVKLNIHQKPVINYAEVDIALAGNVSLTELTEYTNSKLQAMHFKLSAEELFAEINKRRTGFLKNIEKPHMFGIYNAQSFAEGGIERVLSSYGSIGYELAAAELAKLKLAQAETILIQYPKAAADSPEEQKQIITRIFDGNENSSTLIIRQNPSSPLLAVHYMIKHKAPMESRYGKDAAKLLHECIGIRLNSPQMKEISSKYGLTYVVNDNPYIPMDNIYLHPDFGYIRVEGLAEDSEEVIQFLNKHLLNFQPTQQEFEQARGKSKRSGPMMGMGNKAKKMFDRLLDQNLYQTNPFNNEEKINSVEDLRKFSDEYFQPSNMIISVVGPENPDAARQLLSAFQSGAASDGDTSAIYQQLFKTNSEEIKIDQKGDGKQAYLYWGFIKSVSEEDKPALQALSLILADRIVFDVREKQGMAYRMKAGVDIRDDKAAFFVNMGTRAQNVEPLLPQFPLFFDKKYIRNLKEEELRKLINMYLGRMMFRRLSSINQGYYLSHSLYFHNDIEYDQVYLEKLKAVNLDQVKTVAEKYLKAENPIQIVIR